MPIAHNRRTNVLSLAFMTIRLGETQEGISDINQEMAENFKVLNGSTVSVQNSARERPVPVLLRHTGTYAVRLLWVVLCR
jgi:hypothetical protein